MSLKLVRQGSPSTFDAGEISPLLTEATIHHTVRPDGVHQFDFATDLDGSSLAEAVALDRSETVDDEFQSFSHIRTLRAVKAGLKTLTYPNSRIMRHAQYVDRMAKDNLRESRQDIQGIVSTIDHPEHHRMVPANLTIYGGLMAQLEVDTVISEALKDLKPKTHQALCDEYGVRLNELALRRLKGRDRDTYIDAIDYVDDPEKLKAGYKLHRFKRALILPDEEETVLTDAEDWPKDKWSEKADAIQLLLALPNIHADSLGSRWKVLIRDDSSARHVVRPRLLVRPIEQPLEVNQNNSETPRQKDYQGNELVFESQAPIYDRSSHTIIHTSAMLGAVMLMRSINPVKLDRTLQKALYGKGYASQRHNPMPDKALGLAPLLVQNQTIQNQIINSVVFSRLAQHVDTDL